MKKNYIAVFHQAENLFSKILLIFLIVSATNVYSYAQFSAVNANIFGGAVTQKGPFDIMGEAGNLDAVPPVITYTPLTNTCATGNRTLTATITDADGVPTSGAGLPVLYWQINGSSFAAATGVSIGSNQYTFTFGTGATAGNLVSYYIVAQDNVGNVIAKPSTGAGGYTTNPPAAATDPTTLDFYVIQTTLAAGTYNVGVGQTYLTLTDAVNAYNNACLAGPIIFQLMDAAYSTSEIFPITISNPLASSTNTLTIKPNTGINPIIEGSAADAIIKLNGADYITIDGSNSAAATRNLSIINDNTGLTSTVVWLGSAGASNGATHNTIKNCVISGNGATTTYAGIVSSSGVIAGNVAEATNNDNTYQNNSINTSYYGMLIIGSAAGESNTVITGNTIGSTLSTKKLGFRGIFISNETGIVVNNNSVQGVNSSSGVGSDTDPTGGIIVYGLISGGSISSNTISDVKNSSVGGWPAYGICLQSSSASTGMKIYNNFIHSIVAYGNSSIVANNGIGIALQTGGGYGILFNSINLFVNQISAAGGISSCIYISPAITGTASVDLRDNILSDRRTTGTNYAVYCSVPNIIFSAINYNDYYSTTFLGFLGSNRANIAAWQAATGSDGNSVAVNPIFTSTTDLHLQLISPLNDQGTPIAGITTDIDGVTRSATVPDIGADEFTPPVCSGNSGGTVTSDYITVCTSGSVSLSAAGFSYGLGIVYQWQQSTDNVTFTNIAGETNPTSSNPPVINVTTWYRLKVTCAAGSPGFSPSLMITVYNPNILTTTPASRCGPGSVNLAATGTPTTAIQWYTAATGGAPIFTGSPFATPSISSTTTYYAESTFLGSSGTVGLNTPNDATGISTQLTSWQVYFNVIQATKLLTIDVYPLALGENSTIDVYNSSNTIIASVTYTTTVSGGATAQTVTMNVSLPIGNGYYLYATGGIPNTGLTRNLTGAVYPYNSSDIVITGNEFNQNFYMCYYHWRFSNGCSSSPRTPVVATVGVSATINATASPSAICAGSPTTLSATSTNPAFIYTWTPGPMTGATQTVSPGATTTYTVNATDGTCTGTGTVTVTVNPASSNVVIAPASITKCSSAAAVSITATGGDVADENILSENFNGATAPANWVLAGTPAAAAWTLRPDGYSTGGNTYHSNDSTQFYFSNSAASGVTKTTLRTPVFSLAGYSSANLYFYHYFGLFNATDSALVEYATNAAGPWTILRKFNSRGATNKFRKDTISLNAYVGVASNYIRFRFFSPGAGFGWAIDNVSITGGNTGSPITWTPIAGLFTDAAAVTPYLGAATPTVYVKPAVTTTYTATATPVNACQKSQTIDVTIRQLTGSITSNTGSVCPSGAATISIALTGTGPWNLTYTDGITPVTVNNVAVSPYTFGINPLVTTTYTLTALSDTYCTASGTDLGVPVTVTVNPSVFSTWLGLSTDWTDPANWCGGVPTSAKDVSIPSTANSPVITGTTAVAHDITISSGASLTIDPAGMLSFKGVFVNDGTVINNGSLVLNGSAAQSFPGGTTGTITAMNNLEVNNTAGATINKPITLTGTLKPTAGTITLSNIIVTLHSDATSTARVDALGATAAFAYASTGKFSVERYISSATRTAWRFLSAPIVGSQTINKAWQEGHAAGDYTGPGGYGMQIVGPSSAGPGFDMNTVTPSLKTYNAGTNAWVSVPGTLGPISRSDGYMAFIRGDRTANTFGAMSTTTLRVTDTIITGNVTISVPDANTNQYISVGNPYPSAIDFAAAATVRTGLQDVYYLWDPKIGTYGAYVTVAGPGYNPLPSSGSYSTNHFIESGQAFFVVSNGSVTTHSITIKENSKVSSNVQVARPNGLDKQLTTKLYLVTDSSLLLYDGNRVDFDASYSNQVDDLDAPKLTNFGENIGILRDNKNISIERHADIVNTDTIFYQLSQFRQQEYQLEFTPQNLAIPGLTAWLEDGYLHTSKVIDLTTVTTADFSVTADAASKAPDRFRLVFRQLEIVPVTFTSVKAYRQDKDIMVSWKVENELNINHYEIERSVEGHSFSKSGIQIANGNGSGTSEYNWLDVQPYPGDNFYRIKSVGTGNEIKYSGIVKVNITGEPSMITVYPNPVKDGFIGLSFNNQPKGEYEIRLFGANGQLLLKQGLDHPGGSQRVKIPVGNGLAKGMYNLEIILPKNKRRVYKVVIE